MCRGVPDGIHSGAADVLGTAGARASGALQSALGWCGAEARQPRGCSPCRGHHGPLPPTLRHGPCQLPLLLAVFQSKCAAMPLVLASHSLRDVCAHLVHGMSHFKGDCNFKGENRCLMSPSFPSRLLLNAHHRGRFVICKIGACKREHRHSPISISFCEMTLNAPGARHLKMLHLCRLYIRSSVCRSSPPEFPPRDIPVSSGGGESGRLQRHWRQENMRGLRGAASRRPSRANQVVE